jgi:hypothetical protein
LIVLDVVNIEKLENCYKNFLESFQNNIIKHQKKRYFFIDSKENAELYN